MWWVLLAETSTDYLPGLSFKHCWSPLWSVSWTLKSSVHQDLSAKSSSDKSQWKMWRDIMITSFNTIAEYDEKVLGWLYFPWATLPVSTGNLDFSQLHNKSRWEESCWQSAQHKVWSSYNNRVTNLNLTSAVLGVYKHIELAFSYMFL